MVADEVALARLAEDRARHAHLGQVKVEQVAVGVDGGGADDREVDLEAVEELAGQVADQAAGAPPRRTLFMAASYHADYATLLCAPGDLPVAAHAFACALRDDPPDAWDALDLRRLRRDEPAAGLLLGQPVEGSLERTAVLLDERLELRARVVQKHIERAHRHLPSPRDPSATLALPAARDAGCDCRRGGHRYGRAMVTGVHRGPGRATAA